MELILGIIVGLLMLMFLVTGHELGHFIAARRNGVEVEEFGICFPPRALAWRKVDGHWRRIKKSEWDNPPGEGLILSLNWLPIGGFCQMKGESAADKRPRTFGRASFKSKTKILFGGVTVNWLIAIVFLTICAWLGMPHFLDNQFMLASDTKLRVEVPVTIGEVMASSPAQKAGLREGDIIKRARAIDSAEVSISTRDDLLKFNSDNAAKTVYYSVYRQEDDYAKVVEVNLNDAGSSYLLGAALIGDAKYQSTWSAPIVGVMTTLQITGETFKGIGRLLYDVVAGAVKFVLPNQEAHEAGKLALAEAGNSVSGPVGIVGILFPSFMQMGLSSLLFLTALISVSLAVMNVLPIPALDGGRWLLIAIYKLRRKELSKETEERVVSGAFSAILILALIVTVIDIMRFIP